MSSSSADVQAPVRGGNCPLSLALQSSESSFQFALLLDGQRVSELAQLLLQPPYLPPPLALLRAPPFGGGGGRGCHGLRTALGLWAGQGVPIPVPVVPPVVQGTGAVHAVLCHRLPVFNDLARRSPAVLPWR